VFKEIDMGDFLNTFYNFQLQITEQFVFFICNLDY